MSLFQVVGIEVSLFHGGWNRGIQRCPHFRGLECSEVSSFQGVGIEGFRGVLISGGGNRRVQRCPHFKGLE